MTNGLTAHYAARLLTEVGYNELPSAKPKSVWKIAIEVIKEPMFLLLLACGTLYLLLGDYTEGVVLMCWVFVIIGITFYQHRKTEKSLEALRQLSSPRALVIRDGVEMSISGREIVPGDIIILHEGDRVPADAILLESNHLTVDESILTGESVPVLKNENTEAALNSGTLVVQGSGLARVLKTGAHTKIGKIGASLISIDQDATRLQLEMRGLIRNLLIGGAVVSVLVFLAFYFNRDNLLYALLNGLSAAMALLPEEFPVVFTIFLALGAWRLSRNNVLTRKPSAIETLGSATVLCSDKTGTITQNKMEVTALYALGNVMFKADFTAHQDDVRELLEVLHCASAANSVDPMEKAIQHAYNQTNPQTQSAEAFREYPLRKDLFAMTRVYKYTGNATYRVYCKGAPEAIYALCKESAAAIEKYTAIVHELAAHGYRVLAAASGIWSEETLPENQQEFTFSFKGLVAFEDPIRPEVPDAIRECREAGIHVVMITGDYPETAKSIARQIGMKDWGAVLTGRELQGLSEAELQSTIKQTNVFARIVPEQKLQIIRALKANGETVAMTGDGVNDAPALKSSDIGVAMGLKGTDVAREASALVLLDDNFASIVGAIRAGRRIFDNLQKAMSYIIAIHIPIIGLVLIPAFFSSLPVLLMPMHIVFLELIIDPVCALAFESEQEERGIMQRPPRDATSKFFGWKKMGYSLFKGLLLLCMVLGVYFLTLNEGHSDGEIRAIAFSSLVIGNIFLILSSLSDSRSFTAVFSERNYSVFLIAILALFILLLSMVVPAMQGIFDFEFPGINHFIPAFIGSAIMLAVLELVKFGLHNQKARD